MAFYKWYQLTGGDESWKPFVASSEEGIVALNPAFITILQADNSFSEEMTSEDYAKVRYLGDFYVDFDAASLEVATTQFNLWLDKLVAMNLDLQEISLFASGGKGYHATIPMTCFVEKINRAGYQRLPDIYREMAMELYVDTLDMRVYSARKGRMFRTVNVERPDRPGVYKVPVTVDEVRSMTLEAYREICSEPRMDVVREPSTINPDLAVLFASASDKVEAASKRKRSSASSDQVIAKFAGKTPAALEELMQGKAIKDGVGFQNISMQLSLTAHAFKWTEQEFIEKCDGLCKNHSSDGYRYNTESKRRQELRRMYNYMRDNVCYEFNLGGVISLLSEEADTSSLRSGGVELEAEALGDDNEMSLGVRMDRSGIWKQTENGLSKICALGITDPKLLKDSQSDLTIGYDVMCHIEGRDLKRHMLTLDCFSSRAKFLQFTLSTGGANMNATDAQVGALADILRKRAQANDKGTVYTTNKEGVDVIALPSGEVDVIWADQFGVISNLNHDYQLRASWTQNPRGEFATDLRHAPDLTDTPESREYFENLFEINDPVIVAKLLGWYCSTFLCQPIRFVFRQYPFLQTYGLAGSGKSATNELLASMHYHKLPAQVFSASGQTKFALQSLVTSSGSMPVLLDEFKPREMRKTDVDAIKMVIRGNYVGEKLNKGHVNRDSGASTLHLMGYQNTAPLVCLGEALESQTAIVHRAVMVNMSEHGRRGRSKQFTHCLRNRETLSAFGHTAAAKALNSYHAEYGFKRLQNTVEKQVDIVRSHLQNPDRYNDRQIFNIAIVLTGLEFMKMILSEIFSDTFTEKIYHLKNSLLNQSDRMIPVALSELLKVINTLADLSQLRGTTEPYKLESGIDYLVKPDCVHILPRNCYTQYNRYVRSIGEVPLYDSYEAFIAALASHSIVMQRDMYDSPLKTNASTIVFALSLEAMDAEGLSHFEK